MASIRYMQVKTFEEIRHGTVTLAQWANCDACDGVRIIGEAEFKRFSGTKTQSAHSLSAMLTTLS
jgi:hypothetical protein